MGAEAEPRSFGVRISAALWRRPWMRASALLSAPLAWFLLIYLASLVVLFLTSFWSVNEFTTNVERTWSFNNYHQILTNPAYRTIILRSIAMAGAVTLTDAVVAFPFAYFMARVAKRKTQTFLFVAVLVPLWASYIARVYAWQLIFAKDGLLNWVLHLFGLGPANIGYTNGAVWVVFCYLWLPFMILPIYSALERIPDSFLEASADLGGRGWRTMRSVVLPLALPGVVAGSIFTFALTLGDYITPFLVGGSSSTMIGNIVYNNVAFNTPFAAAFATIPVVIMDIYLLGAKTLGAFEAL